MRAAAARGRTGRDSAGGARRRAGSSSGQAPAIAAGVATPVGVTDRMVNLLGLIVAGVIVADLIRQPAVWELELGPLERWVRPPRHAYPVSGVLAGMTDAAAIAGRAMLDQEDMDR